MHCSSCQAPPHINRMGVLTNGTISFAARPGLEPTFLCHGCSPDVVDPIPQDA